MNVVVTAGGMPREQDPLFAMTRGGQKALLDIGGRPMVQWVLDALNGANSVRNIVLVGLEENPGLQSEKPLFLLPDQGDMIANIQAGAREVARLDPAAEKLLVSSSDIPAITPAMVDWLVEQIQPVEADIFYNVIERRTMESRYPHSRRTYLNMRGREVCGGDINAVSMSVALGEHQIWKRLIAARKNPLRQAALIGFDTLFLLLLRRLDLAGAERLVSRRLGIRARTVPCPYAEMGMDVDKPFQLEMMQRELGALRQEINATTTKGMRGEL